LHAVRKFLQFGCEILLAGSVLRLLLREGLVEFCVCGRTF
jgi:hypothetical protein